MILVEHAPGLDRVEPIFGRLVPGDVEHPVDVGAQHLVLGRRRRHALEAIDFAQGGFFDPFGEVRVGDAGADFLDVAVAFAELGLNRLQLLPQHVLALGIGHLLLGARFDSALELEHLNLARQRHGDGIELDLEVVLLEQLLLVLRLHVEQAGEQVGDAQRVVHAGDERLDVGREAGGERERLIDELLQSAHARIDADAPIRGLLERLEERLHDAALDLQKLRLRPRHTLDEHAHAGRRLGHLANDADRPDFVQVIGPRLIGVVLLEQRQDHAVAGKRAIDRLDRHRAVDPERRDTQREHDRAAEWNDGKLGRKRGGRRLGHASGASVHRGRKV